jgi:hypothetical protein
MLESINGLLDENAGQIKSHVDTLERKVVIAI